MGDANCDGFAAAADTAADVIVPPTLTLPATQSATLTLQDLDAPNLSTLIHAAGTQTAKTTQFARIHALRLAALCTMPAHCPHWRAMLAPPLLGKLLALLSRALRDGDTAVRGATAECLGLVARQLAAAVSAGQAPPELTGEAPARMSWLFDCRTSPSSLLGQTCLSQPC